MTKDQIKAIDDCVNILKSHNIVEHIEKFILFGSCARGTSFDNSDIDIYAFTDIDLIKGHFWEYSQLMNEMHSNEPIEIDFHMCTIEDWNNSSSTFKQYVEEDCIDIGNYLL